MPVKPVVKAADLKIIAWSYSRYRDWKKCPAYARYKYIDRMKEPDSPALARGSAIHKLAEDFAKAAAKRKKLPEELACFAEEFKDLQKRRVMVEESWAFTSGWEECDWFAREAWLRVKMDCCYVDLERNVLKVIDHKTGKNSGGYDDQLELYELAGLLKFPDVDGVEAELWFLDQGEIVAHTDGHGVRPRQALGALQKKWLKNTKPMFSDRRFAPKPGNACRWCHFSKAKNGPCKF